MFWKKLHVLLRGEVKPLTDLDSAEFDALILPGGFGVAKNFCDFAVKGADMTVNDQVLKVGKAFVEAKKPAGYMCISLYCCRTFTERV